MSMTFATDVVVNGTDNNGSMVAAGPVGIGGHKIFYGTCESAAGDAKVVSCPSFTSADFVAGAMIYVFFTTTNSMAVADITMNVNSTGAVNVKKIYNGAISNLSAVGELQANMVHLFIYNGANWVLSSADYNQNTTYTVSNNTFGNGTYVASNAIKRYNMLFQVDDDHLTPLCSGNSTGTSKTMLTDVYFNPFGLILYYTTNANVAADAAIAIGATYYTCTGVDLRYSFNVSASVNALTPNKNVYLKVSVKHPTVSQVMPQVKIASATPLTQTLPTTDDTYWYILLGRAYSAYQIALYPHHPIYAYVYNDTDSGFGLYEVTKHGWKSFYSIGTGIMYQARVPKNNIPAAFKVDAAGETRIDSLYPLSCKCELTLSALDWSNDDPPTQTFVGMYNSYSDLYVIPEDKELNVGLNTLGVTKEVYEAAAEAEIACTDVEFVKEGSAHVSTSITFTAFGEKPTVDIPVVIHYTGGDERLVEER